jgi:hypothetical protein
MHEHDEASSQPVGRRAASDRIRSKGQRVPAETQVVDEPPGEPLELDVQPFGPSAEEVERFRGALLAHPVVSGVLGDAERRLLSFRVDEGGTKRSEGCAPDRFGATIFDYTNGRALRVTGEIAALDESAFGDISIEDVATDPLPSPEEFADAVEVLRHDREFRRQIDGGDLVAYQPMPPTMSEELPDGRIDRSVAIGLRAEVEGRTDHRLVAANLFGRRLIDLEGFRWPDLGVCEPPPGNDSCPATGSTGQVNVAVWQAGQKLWDFQVVRPAASSGTNGSGVELRYVNYRGRRVLYRAHVPILNIQYVAGTEFCGPTYRDWQNQEACFQANGTDVIPGVRLCSSPALTILDSGTDAGNFRGVAIYVQGQDVVLVSEMSAGWYRYISEWRLRSDGTIRPIFGFGATDNPCTCNEHIHHVYWRLDFDIRSSWNNIVQEHNDPPLIGGSNWHTKSYEIRRPKDPSRNRYWRVSNASTGEGYELIPGASDGASDAYGVGDLWVLRYRASELDDGQGFTTDPAKSIARIDNFRNPAEPVAGTDVVLWYSAHFRHDLGHASGHRVGPLLRPVNW